jgi:ATP-binding cassette, subfamily B, bacterial PglK
LIRRLSEPLSAEYVRDGFPGGAFLKSFLDTRQRIHAVMLLAAMLLAAAIEMLAIAAVPAFVALLVDPAQAIGSLSNLPRVMGRLEALDTQKLILWSALALAGFYLFKNIYLGCLVAFEGRLFRQLTTDLSIRLFRSYLYCPYTYHLQTNPSVLIRNVNNSVSDAVERIRCIITILRELLVLAVIVALLLVVDPLVSALVFVLLGMVAGAFHLFVRRPVGERGALAQEHHALQLQVINEGLSSIKAIRVLGREQFMLERFNRETHGLWTNIYYQRLITALPRLFLETSAIMAVLVVAVAFVWLDRQPQTMLPVLALLVVVIVRMIPAFNAISTALTDLHYYRYATGIVQTELAAASSQPDQKSFPEALLTNSFRRDIVLEDVYYRYPAATSDALQGVSIKVRRGEVVGIMGPTGAGKSTLVDMILGLLTPTAGKVLADGVDIQACLGDWQRQIGYVPQDIYLTDDSIRRNIAFGLDDAQIDEAAVSAAADAAQVTEFVGKLPDGASTVIGDRGARLSGGQKQRIGIARALYHNPPILILDEATSALDDETESEVISAIERLRGNRTIIIIAHRTSTVRTCDRVIRLRVGQIDSGSV